MSTYMEIDSSRRNYPPYWELFYCEKCGSGKKKGI